MIFLPFVLHAHADQRQNGECAPTQFPRIERSPAAAQQIVRVRERVWKKQNKSERKTEATGEARVAPAS
jgi:hypothetical protein